MATDIVLKDRNGDDVTYTGIETVTFDTPEDGVQATFTLGVEQTGKEVELALADGDQTVTADDGYLLKELTIKQPDTLLPENIRTGVNIAGVAGEYGGDATETVETEEATVNLDFSDGDQVVEPSEGKALSKVTITQPDTLVPENIVAGVEIAGVTGTHEDSGTGGGTEVELEEVSVDLDFSDGDQTVEPSEDGKALSKVTILMPDTLLPENIANGVNIAGIIGTLVGDGSGSGTGTGGSLNIVSGQFKADSTNNVRQVITHGLGEMPDFVMVGLGACSGHEIEGAAMQFMSAWGFNSKFTDLSDAAKGAFSTHGFYVDEDTGTPVYKECGMCFTTGGTGMDALSSTQQGKAYIYTPDDTTFEVGIDSDGTTYYGFIPGASYYWIAMSGVGNSTTYSNAENLSF